MIRLFEAFSGYGSQALAMKRYGIEFESVGIAEIDKYAIQAHEILHGPIKNFGDVSKLSVDELPDMDLFTYSFPCQDISNAGKQRGLEKGSGTRSSLLWECERIIEGKRPKFLMMENVKNLVGKKNKIHFDKWIELLQSLGYNTYWKVINAKWCGVPQNRERVFAVSIRKDVDNGLFNFYQDFDNGIRLKDILESEVEEKYYIDSEKTKGLIQTIKEKGYKNPQEAYTTDGNSYCIDGNYYKGTSKGDVGKCRRTQVIVKEATKKGYKEAYPGDSINLEHPNSKTRRGRVGVGVANCLTTSCNQAIVESNEIIKVGNISPNNFGSMDIHSTNGCGNTEPKILEGCSICGRNPDNPKSRVSGLPTVQMLEVNKYSGISNCLTTVQKDSMVLENKYRIRKLTPYECLILMGLTHEEAMLLVNSGLSNTQLYKMAGNSIVVQCMRFLKKLEAIDILNEDKPSGQLSLF